MGTTEIVWKGILPQTMEYCIIRESSTISVKGYITGRLKQAPLHCSYMLMISDQWDIQSVRIDLDTGLKQVSMAYNKKENGWYDEQNKHIPELDDCTDIDISLTPFTNTLPINRLRLPQGASKEITVVYFDLQEGAVKPIKQRYTRQDINAYLYKNLGPPFTARLEVDDKGLVIDYPGIWERL